MSLSSFLRYSFLVCFTCTLTACQQAQDPPASTAGTSNLQGSQAAADAEPSHRLIGNWEGQLEVDQKAVTELFQREGQEDKLAEALKVYQNMQMTMGFKEGGAMTMSIKIETADTTEENSGSGTWELIRDEGNKSIVKSQEEGSTPQEIELSFEDADHFEMLPKGPFRNAAVLKFSRIR